MQAHQPFLLFRRFPLEQLHRETHVQQLRQDLGGAGEETGEACGRSGGVQINSLTLSQFEAGEEPRTPSLTIGRTPKRSQRLPTFSRAMEAGWQQEYPKSTPKRSQLPTFAMEANNLPPEWQQETTKRVEEVPWIRLKRRRAGRGYNV